MLLVRAALLASILAACTTQVPTPAPSADIPTAAEADALFSQVVERAQGGDFAGMCELGGSNCEAILEAAGDDVPSQDPRIVLNQTMAEARGSAESDAARLLVVCGVKDDGEVYVTEIAVLWRGDTLIAAEPVYWSGLGVSTSGSGINEPEGPPVSIPPDC